jgi:hypothetical protein
VPTYANSDAAELAAKDQIVPSFGLRRQHLVEFRSSDGDVVHAPALFGKELCINALVEWLDQLPLYPADHRGLETPRALDRLAVFAQILCVAGVEFVDIPWADAVVVDVPSQRRVKVAHHDADLHRLGENRPGIGSSGNVRDLAWDSLSAGEL